MSNSILNIGDVLTFRDYNEKIRVFQMHNKNAIIASIYMFSMDGCPPCRTSMQVLFGDGDNNVWKIAVKNFYEQLPHILTGIIERKLQQFDEDPSKSAAVVHIYQYVYAEPSVNPSHKIKELVQMFSKNFYLLFVQLYREHESVTIEHFAVRSFPSWTICVDSDLLPGGIKYSNNKVNLRSGGFASPAQFFEWFNHNIKIILDGLCESVLVALILQKTNQY